MDKLLLVFDRYPERFEIVEGIGEGFYAFRYLNGRSTHDYLQDTAAAAKEYAEEQWNLEPNCWRQSRPGEAPAWRGDKSE
jgi:hypothetical protein